MSIEELIEKLEILIADKEQAIQNTEYERAAQLRDEIRKYNDLLEEAMNPEEDSENLEWFNRGRWLGLISLFFTKKYTPTLFGGLQW